MVSIPIVASRRLLDKLLLTLLWLLKLECNFIINFEDFWKGLRIDSTTLFLIGFITKETVVRLLIDPMAS